MTITVYGIPNCDTVKKARAWLDARGLAYAFYDYKKAGADPARLAAWCDVAGWERVLNRTGTTFRKLPEADRADLDGPRAVAVMAANPSAIKRPIVEYSAKTGDGLLVGFRIDEWERALT